MAGATNPGNIGHAWVKALWIDKEPASGMEHPEEFDANDYDFIPARVSDNPIYAGDESYLKSLRALPTHLKRSFLDGDWNVFAGQYFDRFDCAKHVVRAEQIDWKPWWPRWISIDWGFEHPAAVYWHAQAPLNAGPVAANAANACAADPSSEHGSRVRDEHARRIFTYREFVTHRTSPRDLARIIVERASQVATYFKSRSLGLRPAPLKIRGEAEARGTSLGMTVGWRGARKSVTRAATQLGAPAAAKRSTRFIFRRMRLRGERTKRRLQIKWATCSLRRDCRVLFRRTTIVWAGGC
jgi:hypothetical protein